MPIHHQVLKSSGGEHWSSVMFFCLGGAGRDINSPSDDFDFGFLRCFFGDRAKSVNSTRGSNCFEMSWETLSGRALDGIEVKGFCRSSWPSSTSFLVGLLTLLRLETGKLAAFMHCLQNMRSPLMERRGRVALLALCGAGDGLAFSHVPLVILDEIRIRRSYCIILPDVANGFFVKPWSPGTGAVVYHSYHSLRELRRNFGSESWSAQVALGLCNAMPRSNLHGRHFDQQSCWWSPGRVARSSAPEPGKRACDWTL